MDRVYIGTQPWGTFQDVLGTAHVGISVAIKNRDGTAATHWSAASGGSSSTAAITTDSNGTLARYIEAGEYQIDVAALSITGRRVEAAKGFTVGPGDAQQLFQATTGQYLDAAHGTAAAPDHDPHPVFKITRTVDTISGHTGIGTAAAPEQMSALMVINVAAAASTKQPIAGLFVAKSSATSNPDGTADALAAQGTGRLLAGAVGAGYGYFAAARKDTGVDPGAQIYGIEIQPQNNSGVTDSYLSTGFGLSAGLTIDPAGTADSAVGINIVRSSSNAPQVKVGIGFPSGPGTGGAVVDTTIRDDTNSTTGYILNGTHTTGFDLSGATISGDAIKLAQGQIFKLANSATLTAISATEIQASGVFRAGGFKTINTTTGNIELREQSADPAAPVANGGLVYLRDSPTTPGKTQLVVRFNTGAIQVIATEP